MSDFTPGLNRIGSYPIEREIGRGGMGIVYLGRDTRLDRPVAIKVLPEAFAADPDRLSRFEREARLLASLSHPNIASIHGLEESSGRRFLVLEYVEGETLAQRVARGPLPVDESLDVCRQIAAALEAAHESGVIHRDLKPGNVKLTPAGEVKVLDFGLAKGGGASGGSDPSISASPTMAVTAATGAGVILGTAAYMSPEQARGRAVDRRTDIWSFGCVLYECLTGRQAFAGETVSDMIALILQGEPDWKALPATTPAHVRDLLARCLTKDAKKRLRDIGEARLVLEGGESPSLVGARAHSADAAPRGPSARMAILLAVVFALTSVVLGALLVLRAPSPEPVRRLTIEIPAVPLVGTEAAMAAISPDGQAVVVTIADSVSSTKLWLRPLGDFSARVLPGTEDGSQPSWSPDGRYLVFSTSDKLKKLDLRGGSPEVICGLSSYGRGSSWGSRGTIVFGGGAQGPLFRVDSRGGDPQVATVLDSGEAAHRYPRFLPDGRHFLYAALPKRGPHFTIFVGRLDDPKWRETLMPADGTPVLAEPGWLLFTRNGRLLAQRFDAGARRLSGEPVVLLDEPKNADFLGAAAVIAGSRGPLAYFRYAPPTTRLSWLTLGAMTPVPLPIAPGAYVDVSVSPDSKRACLVRIASQQESDLWLLDLDRAALSRFTRGPGRVDRPTWSFDGTRIAYGSDAEGRWNIWVKSVDGGGPGEAVFTGGSAIKYPSCWTPDGKTLLFEQITEKRGWDVWMLPLEGDRTPRPLLDSSFDEHYPRVSPDGKWIAYASNESGRNEVYVEPFPARGRRVQVSRSGGSVPLWGAAGREILWYAQENSAVIGFDPESGRTIGSPRRLPLPSSVVGGDLARDLGRSLVVMKAGTPQDDNLTIVDHWRSELRRR